MHGVVFLIDDLEVWGGTETHLSRFLVRLGPQRIRPVLAVVGRAGLTANFRAHGITVEPLGIHRTFAPSGLAGVRDIYRLLRRERASLLVTIHTAADLLGPLAGRLAGVPVLSNRRDEGFTKKPIHVKVQRLVNRLLDGMIAVSHSVADVVHRTEGFPRERIRVIWNGEDLERFAPGPSTIRRELGLPPTAVVITSVGSLTPVKDHQTQLEAFERLAQSHPEAHLLVAGEGQLRAELERQARGCAAAPRIHFLGHRKDVPEILRGSDIYLQSSLSEGNSRATLQAMATGLPAVVTAVGGNPELVLPECGVLAPARDSAALAAGLARLVSSRGLRRSMGRAARQRAEACGSIEAMTAAYADAFHRAIGAAD